MIGAQVPNFHRLLEKRKPIHEYCLPKLSSLWEGVNWRRPLIITGLVLGFVVFLEKLGFILSSFLLLFILLKSVEKFSWSKAILIPVITMGCTYLIFDYFLKATLPKGFLGF